MKKLSIFLTVALIASISLAPDAEAKKKKSGGVVKAFGDTVTGTVKNNTSKNVKGGIYGKSSIDAAEEAPAPKAIPTPKPERASITTGVPLNHQVVKKNQNKDDPIAAGILFLSSEEFDKALAEFKKAQSLSNDPVVQRWVDVATNKLKLKEISLLTPSDKPLN